MNIFENCTVEVPGEGIATISGELPDGVISMKRVDNTIVLSCEGKSISGWIQFFDEPTPKPKREFLQ